MSLKCSLASRCHHLVKTFWGWTDKQLADGTLILTSSAGCTYVTTPGSSLLFPSLCHWVGGMPAPEADPHPEDYCAERTAMMPQRTRTRAQRINTERRRNRQARTTQPTETPTYTGPAPPPPTTTTHHRSKGEFGSELVVA